MEWYAKSLGKSLGLGNAEDIKTRMETALLDWAKSEEAKRQPAPEPEPEPQGMTQEQFLAQREQMLSTEREIELLAMATRMADKQTRRNMESTYLLGMLTGAKCTFTYFYQARIFLMVIVKSSTPMIFRRQQHLRHNVCTMPLGYFLLSVTLHSCGEGESIINIFSKKKLGLATYVCNHLRIYERNIDLGIKMVTLVTGGKLLGDHMPIFGSVLYGNPSYLTSHMHIEVLHKVGLKESLFFRLSNPARPF